MTDRYFWPVIAALTITLIISVSLIVGKLVA